MANNPDAPSAADLEAGRRRSPNFFGNFRRFRLTKPTTQQEDLLLLGVATPIFDPLFFYIPMIDDASKCFKSDLILGVVAISLRSLWDMLYFLLRWLFDKNKQVSQPPLTEQNEEKNPPDKTPSCCLRISEAKRRTAMDILCVLPLPQFTTLAILIIKGEPRSVHAVTLLKFSVLIQFVLRAFRVFYSFHEAMTNSFTLLKSHFWIGAGFNLLLFVMASHVLGAFWYLLSVGRMMDCWKSACRKRVGCKIGSLYCGGPKDNKSYLDDYCPIQQATNSSAFDFGIYLSALESNIVGSTIFPLKLSYSFWWGLRNLSSMGQNLTSSAYVWEILFSISISILGLILVSLLIGNMQAYFQYQTTEELNTMKEKIELVTKKQNDLSNWQLFGQLPCNIQEDIRSCLNNKWLKTPEVNIETALEYLPKDLSKMVKDYIFSYLDQKVGMSKSFGEGAQASAVISRMKPRVYAKGAPMFNKGSQIDEMVFKISGELMDEKGSTVRQSWYYRGGELLKQIRSGSYDTGTSSLENRLQWAANIKAKSKVEAIVLDANDLLCLVNEFKNMEKGTKELIDKTPEKWSKGSSKSKQR